MIYIIIYSVGLISALILYIHYTICAEGRITVLGLFAGLFFSALSWIGSLVILLTAYGDRAVYSSKSKTKRNDDQNEEIDIDEEFRRYLLSQDVVMIKPADAPLSLLAFGKSVARHFYELGCRGKKELAVRRKTDHRQLMSSSKL